MQEKIIIDQVSLFGRVVAEVQIVFETLIKIILVDKHFELGTV